MCVLLLLLLQMNVSELEGELSRAMAQKAETSGALSEAVAVKVAAEQRLNSILVSRLCCNGSWHVACISHLDCSMRCLDKQGQQRHLLQALVVLSAKQQSSYPGLLLH